MLYRETLVGRRVKSVHGLFSKPLLGTIVEWDFPSGIYIETPDVVAVLWDGQTEKVPFNLQSAVSISKAGGDVK